MRDLGQPFYPIFTPFGPLFPNPDHFFKSLKHLKKQKKKQKKKKKKYLKDILYKFSYHISLTYISKSFQLKSISFKARFIRLV